MKHSILISLLLALLGSCKTELTDKEIKWNPYMKGEVLVFESSQKELDTVFITDIVHYFSNEHEILEVKCTYLQSISGNSQKQDTVKSFLLALTASENNNTVLTINLSRKFARFAPFVAKRISWLDSLQITSIQSNYRSYHDVIILEPDIVNPELGNNDNDSLFVSKLYWSRSAGLIRFDLPNNKTTWQLKNRYSL